MKLTLDELNQEDDRVVESQGVRVVYGSALEEYIANSVIDYSRNFLNRGFYIKGSRLSSC